MNLSDCFYLGYISRVTGTEGKCSIRMDVDDPTDYKNLESILIQMNQEDQSTVPFFLHKTLNLKGDVLDIQLDLEGQFQFESTQLKGKSVFLPLSALKNLGENKFYFHEIIGFEVEDVNYGSIGTVTEVYEMPADPVVAVLHEGKEILIPIRDEIILTVDKNNRKLTVKAPEGLIEMYLS